MASFTLRSAQPGDRVGVDAMLARSYPPLLAASHDAEILAAALPAMIRASPTLLECETWFVAVSEAGEIVGCGGGTRARPGSCELEPGLGHVRHFGTHVDHLRRGIGRAIASRMFTTARDAGVERLECYSTLAAERFYLALGFRTSEAINVPIPRLDRPGEFIEFPSLLMRRDLRDPAAD